MLPPRPARRCLGCAGPHGPPSPIMKRPQPSPPPGRDGPKGAPRPAAPVRRGLLARWQLRRGPTAWSVVIALLFILGVVLHAPELWLGFLLALPADDRCHRPGLARRRTARPGRHLPRLAAHARCGQPRAPGAGRARRTPRAGDPGRQQPLHAVAPLGATRARQRTPGKVARASRHWPWRRRAPRRNCSRWCRACWPRSRTSRTPRCSCRKRAASGSRPRGAPI